MIQGNVELAGKLGCMVAKMGRSVTTLVKFAAQILEFWHFLSKGSNWDSLPKISPNIEFEKKIGGLLEVTNSFLDYFHKVYLMINLHIWNVCHTCFPFPDSSSLTPFIFT